LASSDGFNSEQKYAIITKTLDFIKKVPKFSYSVNLGTKFGLNPKSTIQDVHNFIEKMGFSPGALTSQIYPNNSNVNMNMNMNMNNNFNPHLMNHK
jgi:hypothetical protein